MIILGLCIGAMLETEPGVGDLVGALVDNDEKSASVPVVGVTILLIDSILLTSYLDKYT